MSDRILRSIFKADTSDFEAGLKRVTGTEGGAEGIHGMTKAVGILNGLLEAGIIAGIGASIQKAFGDYSNYVTEVDNLATSLGISMEEADGLYGSMERYDVSANTMIGAFRRMATDGIDPTLENLGKILQAYEDMPEGAEKGVEAMRILGEQGIAELLPWYDNLSDYEKGHLDDIDAGMGLTSDAAAANREFRDSIADLTDEWSILKGELLGGIIPVITNVLEYITNAVQIAKDLAAQIAIIRGASFERLTSAPVPPTSSMTGITVPSKDEFGFASGGSFIVGGRGGSDTTPVSFMATPGETVSVGGGTNDMAQILSEVRRLVDTLPVTIADAMERR